MGKQPSQCIRGLTPNAHGSTDILGRKKNDALEEGLTLVRLKTLERLLQQQVGTLGRNQVPDQVLRGQ